MISRLIWLCAAGAAGTGLRVALSGWIQRSHATSLPLGTAAVNVLGCALFGVAVAWLDGAFGAEARGEQWRLWVLSGFLGGFTTFSSYAFESVGLLQRGQALYAVVNMGAQNLLGLLGLWAGLQLGRPS